MSRRVLVTGAAGFTGAHVLRRLRAEGDVTLVGMDRAIPPAQAAAWDDVQVGDIRDAAFVHLAVRAARPDLVYHLAGIARGTDDDLRAVNVGGTAHVLEAIREHAAEAGVLVVGSAAEYGAAALRELPLRETASCEPLDAYGRTKHEAVNHSLEAASRHGLRVAVARPFNIVGAGVPPTLVVGAVIGRLRGLLASGATTIPMGNVDTLRDFIAIEDVVDGYVHMLGGSCWGRIVNLCSGEPRSIRSLVEALVRVARSEARIVVDPALVRPNDIPSSYGSYDEAHRLWGFRPRVTLAQSLQAAWEFAAQPDHAPVPSS